LSKRTNVDTLTRDCSLPAQRFDLLTLLAAQNVLAPALISFDLAHVCA
jgi:hypothetical protein